MGLDISRHAYYKRLNTSTPPATRSRCVRPSASNVALYLLLIHNKAALHDRGLYSHALHTGDIFE